MVLTYGTYVLVMKEPLTGTWPAILSSNILTESCSSIKGVLKYGCLRNHTGSHRSLWMDLTALYSWCVGMIDQKI